ncbi:MAG: hypothetical protein JSR18_03005 [Proteobacteria bacterium]|nr:hypothetical protein [Pseudomonadota bacterium]
MTTTKSNDTADRDAQATPDRKTYTAPRIGWLGGFRERTLSGGSGAPDTNQSKGIPT